MAIGDINDPQSFNRYAYARMNPSSFTDPSGQVVSPVVIGLVEEAKSRAIEEFSNYAYDRSYAGEGLSADAWNLAGDAASLAYWYLNDAPLWVQAGGAVISGGAGAAVASSKVGKKVVKEAVEEAAEVAAQQAARGGRQTYEIGEGVRRAKATDIVTNGNGSVNAKVLVGDKVVETKDIPCCDLLSPKESIDVTSTRKKFERWQSIVEGAKDGTLPPIEVRPGTRGTPISDVEFE